MDKELALIFEYAKAPESLKTMATTHRQNYNQLQKKTAALRALQAEVATLQKAYDESAKGFAAELKAWTPTGV